MLQEELIQSSVGAVAEANTIFLFFAADASLDQQAATLALALGLESLGKNVAIFSPQRAGSLANIAGGERVVSQLGNQSLQVSFDYIPEMVDKVSYHIDDTQQKFHLIIQPKKGVKPLDPASISYGHVGADADLLISVGVRALEDLEQLYFGYEYLFDSTAFLSITPFDPAFGTMKLNTAGETLAEVSLKLLQAWQVTLSADVSTNLLLSLDAATDGFRSLSTTADAFMAAATLLRSGARRTAARVTEASRVPHVKLGTAGETTSIQNAGFAAALEKASGKKATLGSPAGSIEVPAAHLGSVTKPQGQTLPPIKISHHASSSHTSQSPKKNQPSVNPRYGEGSGRG